MRRIYEDQAYQTPDACWWRETISVPDCPRLTTEVHADVVVIGGGFTGLNAALALANDGVSVVVLDAEQPGWGASGRNGGFCCLGGAKIGGDSIARRYGQDARRDWHRAERVAVDHVAELLQTHNISADTHSNGETLLAHTPKAMQTLRAEAEDIRQTYGVEPDLFDAQELRQRGLHGNFYGGVTNPIGFALNPAKYHRGLLNAAQKAGVKFYGQSPATSITRAQNNWRVTTPKGAVRADKVLIATNGYSSEDLPHWLRARYLPVQSTIIVTRPISPSEQTRQGWTSTQMCYDTRILLHYFRLMPDGRFLFGMRGGLRATQASEAHLSRKIRADFQTLFPEWREVEITHEWSGLLCLTRRLTPFAGPVPGMPGVFAALGYHGNGVAMGSYLGARMTDPIMGLTGADPLPGFLSLPPKRFPLGAMRRALLAPTYAAAALLDR